MFRQHQKDSDNKTRESDDEMTAEDWAAIGVNTGPGAPQVENFYQGPPIAHTQTQGVNDQTQNYGAMTGMAPPSYGYQNPQYMPYNYGQPQQPMDITQQPMGMANVNAVHPHPQQQYNYGPPTHQQQYPVMGQMSVEEKIQN